MAATGNTSAEKAMNWLVAHINDPRLDEATMREYALYAIPIGTFGEQLLNFWYDSRELCVWNAGHCRLPHVTIVSFFKVKFCFCFRDENEEFYDLAAFSKPCDACCVLITK